MANPTTAELPVALAPATPVPATRRWPLVLVFALSLFLGERLFRAGAADLVGVSRALSLLLVTLAGAWVVLSLRGLED